MLVGALSCLFSKRSRIWFWESYPLEHLYGCQEILQNLSFKLFSLSCMFANNTSSRVQTGRAYLTSLRSHPITHSENLVQFRRHIIILCLLLKSLSADHPQQDLKDRCLEILSSIREILKTLVVPCQGLDHQLERCPEVTGTRLS